jgi:CheY-like chemotaxis protein
MPRRGSRFFFSLELPASVAASESDAAAGEMCRLAPGGRVRALVVDDAAANRNVLSAMLRLAGCDCTTAENGWQAIQSVRELRPDIVFMDMRLRGLDGIRAARLILHDQGSPLVRIVATSASVLEDERERCLAAGCDEFLAKPFRTEQIYSCVARLLNVEFVRDGPGRDAPPLSPSDLARITLPEELIARMSSAAERHSATTLRACLDQLEGGGPDARHLAENLRRCLASYDMDAIRQILADVSVSAASARTA